MRVATRLVLVVGVSVTGVMLVYGVVALRQRAALLRAGLIHETETLGRATQIAVDDALRDGRFRDLSRVLERVAGDPETVIAAVVDTAGRMLAGGPAAALGCVRAAALPGGERAGSMHGWVRCRDTRVRWVALPVRRPGSVLLIGRRETVVEQDMAASRVRILLTMLALAAAASLAILLVLRRTLLDPLAELMRGVRSLGGPTPPVPVRLSRSAGELQDFAAAFNEMSERLEGKRAALIREVEERLALERRLRVAEKFAAIGRLAGGLAHELGSPLSVVSLRAEAILGDPAVRPSTRRQAEEILAEVDRIGQLIRALRLVSRRQPLVPVPVDLSAVVASVGAALRRGAPAGVQVTVEVGGGAIVAGDETLLAHAVTNLARNAIQALDRGGVGGIVHLAVRVARGFADVVVEDDGPGIAPEDQPRLFEPFFTTREVGEGMGLGLPISQGIADEHGGALRVEPRPGGGVRATLTLPLRAGEPEDRTDARDPAAAHPAGRG